MPREPLVPSPEYEWALLEEELAVAKTQAVLDSLWAKLKNR